MKSRKLALLSSLICFSIFSGAMGCGSGEGASGLAPDPSISTLTIIPSSVSVKKGQTFDFNTNKTGASFSVVGGASNGSIDADGIYTPPALLPANTKITIQATLDSETANANINLITADTISMSGGSRKKITDTPLDIGSLITADSQLNLSRNRIAVSDQNNHQVAALWTSESAGITNSSFDLMNNFGLFGTDHAPVAAVDNIFSGTIGFGTDGSLHIIQLEKSGAKYGLQHHSTSNGGTSYASHPVYFDGALHSFSPSLTVDTNNTLHVIFLKGATPLSAQNILYTKSSDGGATWSSPVEINAASPNGKLQAQLATNASGTEIDVCWAENSAAQTDIYYARSSNSGTSFSAAIPVTNTPAVKEGQCQVKRGNTTESYVLYSGLFAGFSIEDMEIFIAKTADGTSFSPAVQVNSDSYHRQVLPYMSVDTLGRIDVVWSWDQDGDGSSIPEKIYHARSTDAGNTFSANEAYVIDGAGLGILPQGLVHDSSGRLHMTYIQREGADYHLFYQMAE